MQTDKNLRSELDEFVRTGWMDYVVRAGGWWDTPEGKLKQVRRNSIPAAYYSTRLQLEKELCRTNTLYRTLLLSEDFDLTVMLDQPYDFGLFWTNDISVAHSYRPRRCYQTEHIMPVAGIPCVVAVNDIQPTDIDWISSVGCRLTNPTLCEFRMRSGTKKIASSVRPAWRDDDTLLVTSTPPVDGIWPVPEGPGFIENFALLNKSDGLRR